MNESRNIVIAESLPYITTHQSELCMMSGLSLLSGKLETGGDLYCSWSRGDRPLIHLAVGPGPNAIHEPAYFRQDIDFCRRNNDYLYSTYGIQWGGTWHSHPMRIEHPSGGDIRQVQSVTRRNNIQRWFEMIITFEPDPRIGGLSHNLSGSGMKNILKAKINSFLYTDPQCGEKIQIPLRILQGLSPVRLALLANGGLDPADMGQHGMFFPFSQTLCEVTEKKTNAPAPSSKFLDDLASQCPELPPEVQESITFHEGKNMVLVRMALSDRWRIGIGYLKYPFRTLLTAVVRDTQTGDEVEVISVVLQEGHDLRLRQIYDIVLHKLSKKSDQDPSERDERPWSIIRHGCMNGPWSSGLRK